MAKQFVYGLLFTLFLGVTFGNARDAKTDEQSSEKAKPTKFEQFISRSDVLIVSKSYSIGKMEGSNTDVSVKVAWELGKADKVYAASINYKIVDFEQLQETQDAINKMIHAIKAESDRLELGSLTLSTKSGLAMDYYTYRDSSGTLKRTLYLKIKDGFIHQGPSIEPLSSLGSLVAQAREKLVSLGAK